MYQIVSNLNNTHWICKINQKQGQANEKLCQYIDISKQATANP
jgi:hypothetical protein